jgi:hypothetical protein
VSPVFPTVGRKANATDLEILTVVANNAVLGPLDVWLSDVEHLGLDINDQIERWKVFNTAWVTNTDFTQHPYTYEGEFSYYESEETYPNLQNCNGGSIWGLDSADNVILPGDKIRLIKFPDRRLISHISSNGEYIVPFGIKFDNITYPIGVIGHKFVFADRTDFDKTVVDSGWSNTPKYRKYGTPDKWIYLGQARDFLYISASVTYAPDPFEHNFYDPALPESHYIRYNSSNILQNELNTFSYYKTNRVHKFGTGLIGTNAPNDYAFIDIDGGRKLYSVIRDAEHITNVSSTRVNYLDRQTFLIKSKDTISAQGLLPDISNDDLYNNYSVSYINYGLEDTTPLLGLQVVDSLHNGTRTQFDVHQFYTYKKSTTSPYNNLLNRSYKSISTNFSSSLLTEDNIYYGGDTLITSSQDTRLAAYYENIGLTDDACIYSLNFKHHFEEHSLNMSLRHAGTDNKYYKSYSSDGDKYFYDKFSILNGDGNLDLYDKGTLKYSETYLWPDVKSEFVYLNKDYDVRLFEKGKVALPESFDYCADCIGRYPNRIVFSPKSFDEEEFDLYRINKVNDYIDMPAHRGAITGLKYQNNQLLVHMEDSTFILQPNPQQISTDQNTAYLTTGDFLSVPPQELLQTDVGTAGLQNKQSMCNTPFGHCWADQKRGELFKWSGQIESLSSKGLTQWFKERLSSDLQNEYYRVLGRDYPLKSSLAVNGIGCILYYDPRFKRLMVTKRDFYPLNLKINFEEFPGGSSSNASYYQEESDEWYTLSSGTPTVIYTQQPQWFENKSWTLSYNFQDQAWCSWHSYIPWHSFADSNNFYTTSVGPGKTFDNSPIWKHLNKNNYQKYYNTKYDFIIEWQNMDPVSSDVSNLYYVGYSHIWDATNKQFKTVDTTFNKLLMYNFEQSTGLQSLILQNQNSTNPYGNTSLPSSSKYVIKTDQNYKIAGMYDMSIAQPVMTEDWNQRQLYTGYIDLVPNTTNINFNKSPYDWGNIWDKFVNIRLYYKPTEDHRKSVLLQVLNSQQSIR